MYNNDLYKELEIRFGRDRMFESCEVISEMYSILDWNSPKDIAEYNFEKEWWMDKYLELLKEKVL
jgi:hypothetical protein